MLLAEVGLAVVERGKGHVLQLLVGHNDDLGCLQVFGQGSHQPRVQVARGLG